MLITTPGALDANSYVSEADATEYLTNARLYGSTWTKASSGDREKALRWATYLLDLSFDWGGSTLSDDQPLRWPRYAAVDPDGRYIDQDTIPFPVARAAAELAMELLKGDRQADSDLIGLGFSEAKVGPISVKIDPNSIKQLVPVNIVSLLDGYGTFRGGSSPTSGRIVKLYRS